MVSTLIGDRREGVNTQRRRQCRQGGGDYSDAVKSKDARATSAVRATKEPVLGPLGTMTLLTTATWDTHTNRHPDTHHTQIHTIPIDPICIDTQTHTSHVDTQTDTHCACRHTGRHTLHRHTYTQRSLLINITTLEETIGKGNTAVLMGTKKPLVPSLRGEPLELMHPHRSFSVFLTARVWLVALFGCLECSSICIPSTCLSPPQRDLPSKA